MVKLKTLTENYLQENFYLAQSTKDTTERSVNYFVSVAGNLNLDVLEYRHFEKYKNFLLKSHRAKTTANMYVRAIRPVLNWAIKLKLIEANPMDGLKEFKITPKPIKIYEDWEVERMLRYSNLRWKAIIVCARTTGLRRGEILNLTLNNIRSGFVWVEPKRDTTKTWEWEPKDKEIRRVPLVSQLRDLINGDFYPMLPPAVYENLLKLKRAGLLTERRRKRPNDNFRRDFVNIQRKAFGRQIGDFHSLRKTYATEMCEVLPQHFVMKLTGHSSAKTMTHYLSARESYYNTARDVAARCIKTGTLACRRPSRGGVNCESPTGRYRT